MKKILYWLPRILAIIFILFISMFALDSFDVPQWYIALPMHLIPSFILILFTVIAWQRARIGGILFFVAACGMGVISHSTMLVLPLFLISVLFFEEGKKKSI